MAKKVCPRGWGLAGISGTGLEPFPQQEGLCFRPWGAALTTLAGQLGVNRRHPSTELSRVSSPWRPPSHSAGR